jgi:hypothetical protein
MTNHSFGHSWPHALPRPIASSPLKHGWFPTIPVKLSWQSCLTVLCLLYWRVKTCGQRSLTLFDTTVYTWNCMFGHLCFLHRYIWNLSSLLQRGSNQASEAPIIASDEDVLSLIMERHDLFLSSTKSRLMKLQVSALLDNLAVLVV